MNRAAGVDNLTVPQQERRDRILAATLSLTLAGGYEGVQMRDVAAQADVALGTLYRYFPSKEHLLASAMLSEVRRLAARLAVRPPRGGTPGERVLDVLARANRALLLRPEVGVAQIRALVSGNAQIGEIVQNITDQMRSIILTAIGADPTEQLIAAADTISDVWLSALVGWISGVTPVDGVHLKLRRVVEQVLGLP